MFLPWFSTRSSLNLGTKASALALTSSAMISEVIANAKITGLACV